MLPLPLPASPRHGGDDAAAQPWRPHSSLKYGDESGATWRPATPSHVPATSQGAGAVYATGGGSGGFGATSSSGGSSSAYPAYSSARGPAVSERFLKLVDTVCNDLHRLGVHDVTIPMFEQHFARMRNGKKVAYRKLGYSSMQHLFSSQPSRFLVRLLPDGNVGIQTTSYAAYQAKVRGGTSQAASGHPHQPMHPSAAPQHYGGHYQAPAPPGGGGGGAGGGGGYTPRAGGAPPAQHGTGLQQPFAGARSARGAEMPFPRSPTESQAPVPVTVGFAPPPPESVTASTAHSTASSSAASQFQSPGSHSGAQGGGGGGSVSSQLSAATGLEGSSSYAGYNAWPTPKGASKSTTAGAGASSTWTTGVASAPATIWGAAERGGDHPPSASGAPEEMVDALVEEEEGTHK